MSSGATHVAGSVVVNGVAQPTYDPVAGSVEIDGVSYPAYDPAAGFPLKDLTPGESVTVRFKVLVQ